MRLFAVLMVALAAFAVAPAAQAAAYALGCCIDLT